MNMKMVLGPGLESPVLGLEGPVLGPGLESLLTSLIIGNLTTSALIICGRMQNAVIS